MTPGGLARRLFGFWIWRAARAESLPVAPLPGAETPPLRPLEGRIRLLAWFTRVVSAVAVIVGLAAITIGLVASRTMHSIETNLLENPAGDPLLEQADQLRSSVDRAWWVRFYPSYPERIRLVAEGIEAGRSSLLDAAETYVRCGEQLATMGLPARLLQGREIVAPLEKALQGITTQFHRETVTFLQLQGEIRPYLKSAEDRAVLRGSIVSGTDRHALMIAGIGPDGAVKWKTADPLEQKRDFQIALSAVPTVRFTDMVRTEGSRSWQVIDSVDLPLNAWNDAPLHFPHSGATFRIDFLRSKQEEAPPFQRLSPASRVAIAPVPPTLRG